MMPSTHIAPVPRLVPLTTVLAGREPAALPLNALGPVDEEDHILVLGGQGPELMCALLRAGATNVTHLRTHERPEADSASLVIVPRVPSVDWLATALSSIRRALTPNGRLVLQAGAQTTTQTEIRRMLALHGMCVIRAETCPDGQVFSAAPRRRQTT